MSASHRRTADSASVSSTVCRSNVLHVVEQPHVLDGDHRLVGEGRHQGDLTFGERFDDAARQHQDADGNALAQHRHAEDGSRLAELRQFGQREFGIGRDIRNLDRRASEHDASDDIAAINRQRPAVDESLELFREAVACHPAIAAVARHGDGSPLGTA
jgi:hypothetical protein